MASKVPSPCIGVCKFKRAGRCIGCSMTKKQKKNFKKLSDKKLKRGFVRALVDQQAELGKYRHWLPAYQKKCDRKGVACPLDG